ncbi:MAG: 4-fold beta flower protein [Coriobacteriia bacterium]
METTLYDAAGQPVAYIAEDGELAVYLWSGEAVAYIDGEIVRGWNGRHLGFFVHGVLYDTAGRRTGAVADQCSCVMRAEPVKQPKRAKRVKFAPHAPSSFPSWSMAYSDEPLVAFLGRGTVASA